MDLVLGATSGDGVAGDRRVLAGAPSWLTSVAASLWALATVSWAVRYGRWYGRPRNGMGRRVGAGCEALALHSPVAEDNGVVPTHVHTSGQTSRCVVLKFAAKVEDE